MIAGIVDGDVEMLIVETIVDTLNAGALECALVSFLMQLTRNDFQNSPATFVWPVSQSLLREPQDREGLHSVDADTSFKFKLTVWCHCQGSCCSNSDAMGSLTGIEIGIAVAIDDANRYLLAVAGLVVTMGVAVTYVSHSTPLHSMRTCTHHDRTR